MLSPISSARRFAADDWTSISKTMVPSGCLLWGQLFKPALYNYIPVQGLSPENPDESLVGIKKHLFLLFLILLCSTISHSLLAQAGEWTWMKGIAFNAQNAVYGIQGVA